MKIKHLLTILIFGPALVLALIWLLGRTPDGVLAQAGTGVIRVDDATGTDTSGCGDAATPCKTIQYAVDQAQPGDEIHVATGVYTGVQGRPVPAGYPNGPAGGLITQVVYISKTVTVRGGYTTADWDTFDPDANPTTLDAQGLGRVMVIAGEISPTVEGLLLTGGDAAGLGGTQWTGQDGGGGMYVISATATITNNRVFSNTTDDGGGLFLWHSPSTLSGNTVYSNSVNKNGGGLYLWYSDATLGGNTISTNTATDLGGGLYLYSSAATLDGNTISANAVNMGGGLYLDNSPATLSGNTISANTANNDGGGLYLFSSAATLSGNTVSSNTADNGGGLHLHDSAATLNGNTIFSNTATSDGGGLYLYSSAAMLGGNTVLSNTANRDGGGLFLDESDITLTNTVIADNRADGIGSGLYAMVSSPRLLHTTIARNTGGDGSGVRLLNSTAVLTNTILVSHTVGITVAAGCAATLESTLWATGTAWANVNNTGGGGTINTNHDYGGDPAFVNPNVGDYHIALGSAAVDKGVDAGVPTDKDGVPRPQGPAPDLGAYEVEQLAPVGGVTVPVDRPAAWPWLALSAVAAVGVVGAAALLRRRRV